MIIFLDFDGVISSHRAYNANQHLKGRFRWIDPIACGLLRHALDVNQQARIVITSTWRHYPDDCNEALAKTDLSPFLYIGNWRTGRDVHSKESADQRPREIRNWLAENEPTRDYIILDDDAFNWSNHQEERWIQPEHYDGFSFDNYVTLMEMLNNGK